MKSSPETETVLPGSRTFKHGNIPAILHYLEFIYCKYYLFYLFYLILSFCTYCSVVQRQTQFRFLYLSCPCSGIDQPPWRHMTTVASHDSEDVLCGACLVASPQVVDVDQEAGPVVADHVPDLGLVHALVLL